MSGWITVHQRTEGGWWWACSHPDHERDDPLALATRQRVNRLPGRTEGQARAVGERHVRVHHGEQEGR